MYSLEEKLDFIFRMFDVDNDGIISKSDLREIVDKLIEPSERTTLQKENKLDEKINEILNPVSAIVVSIVFFSVEIFEGIKVPLIVVWLIVAAVFCTIYFGFVNIRHFGTAIKIFRSNEKDLRLTLLVKDLLLAVYYFVLSFLMMK